jgi:hypothetical protein
MSTASAQLPPTKPRRSPAAWFLLVVAALLTLSILGLVGYKLFEPQLWRWAYVPSGPFLAQAAPAPDYAAASAWAARPGPAGNPAMQAPPDYQAAPRATVDVFYLHPTTFLNKSAWNGPIAETVSAARTDEMLRHQASAFNGVGRIWAPRYRQATFGAFLAPGPNATQALDLAYQDVLRAFDAFIAQTEPLPDGRPRPFILAGHSQGSLHGLRLLKDRIAGAPLAERLVVAYLPGWPIAAKADLGALPGLALCKTPEATRCVATWQTYARDGDPSAVQLAFASTPGLSGQPRAGEPMACANPLSFWADDRTVDKASNIGALDFAPAGQPLLKLQPEAVAAQCDSIGVLRVSPPPRKSFQSLVMPGGNYHVYDYGLFWANIRANAEARVAAFLQPR